MSIVTNCFQYLLGVAEKIIIKCADKQTSEKYFKLKEQVMDRCNVELRYSCNSVPNSDKQNSKSSLVLKMSNLTNNEMTKSKKSITRKSTGKSRQKRTNEEQISATKKISERLNSQKCLSGEYAVLIHLAAIIKNAQSCPNMLKTITFKPNNFSKNANSIVQDIASSLASIYQIINNPIPLSTSKITVVQQNPPKINELIIDNKWLLSKLEAIINENIVLRRMSGLKVDD